MEYDVIETTKNIVLQSDFLKKFTKVIKLRIWSYQRKKYITLKRRVNKAVKLIEKRYKLKVGHISLGYFDEDFESGFMSIVFHLR